jgi:hypothetical protein
LPAFVALGLAACGFNPHGAETSGDGPPGDDDAPTAGDAASTDGAVLDAPVIDAPAIDAPAIDARPIDAAIDAPACPSTYDVDVGTSHFRFVTNPQPLGNAIADCGNDSAGTHLATFELAADLETAHAGRGGNEVFWVHAVCSALASVPCDDTAAWRWLPDSEPVTDTLWANGEPNNPSFERNAISFKEMGNWRLNNVVATENHAYICECGD